MDRKKKVITLVIIGWVLSVLVIVSAFLLHKYRQHKVEDTREVKSNEMIGQIRNGQSTFFVDPDALAVSGEDLNSTVDGEDVESQTEVSEIDETWNLTFNLQLPDLPEQTETEQKSDSTDGYELTAYGTINIPSIDCDIPLWEGAGNIELRYGAGRMPLSANAGENGNLVIYGHRMRRYGSMFNRLGEVQNGDSIVITRNDGSSFTYIVDQIETIEPSQITSYIEIDDGSPRITLITCTPTGVGSHRLLVIGHMC